MASDRSNAIFIGLLPIVTKFTFVSAADETKTSSVDDVWYGGCDETSRDAKTSHKLIYEEWLVLSIVSS